ncbi:MAG: hypothetical protein R3E74_14815 [Pseudomonadales bacterium]
MMEQSNCALKPISMEQFLSNDLSQMIHKNQKVRIPSEATGACPLELEEPEE